MKISEAAAILTMASSYDKRTVGEADAQAWALALGDMRLQDARDAVVAHFTESTEWLTPAHVTRLVRHARSARVGDISSIVPPRELADMPAREHAWKRELLRAMGDGATEPQAIAAADASQGIAPEHEPLAIESSVIEIRDRMAETATRLALSKNLAVQERAAKTERFRAMKAKRAESEQALRTEATA